MELKRTKGPAVSLAQPKNRRFEFNSALSSLGPKVWQLMTKDSMPLSHQRSLVFVTINHPRRLVVLTARPSVLDKPVGCLTQPCGSSILWLG